MKKLIPIILVTLLSAVTMLSSCASLGFGTSMPMLETHKAFENDTWLVVNHMLINKTTGEVALMSADSSAKITLIDNIYYNSSYDYKYEFGESSFKEYTFLESNYYDDGLGGFTYLYYECVLTYSYDGVELEREYIGEPLTEEEMNELYNTNPSNTDAFSFYIDFIYDYSSHDEYDYINAEKRAVLDFVEDLYEAQSEKRSAVVGSARPMGEEIWFSTVVSDDLHYNSGNPILEGIRISEIKAYDPESDETRTVFEYNKKGKQIIDFDENGIYILDSKGNFNYVDFETKKSTLIHKFSSRVYSFELTDDYICASYEDNENGYCYLVYQKGGSVIADGVYAKYNYVGE